MNKVRIVSAMRATAEEFRRSCQLGKSILRFKYDPRIVTDITYCNTLGLPVVYNRAIQNAHADEVLVFVHDDVFIDDFNLFPRFEEALYELDVVGVAGNTNPDPRHVSWLFLRENGNNLIMQDRRTLSGVVGHFEAAGPKISGYGLSPQHCVLLDGCFLAANVQALRERQVLFDERFNFHFYDIDFARTAASRRLRVGTWPIAVTHQSSGNFGSPAWEDALRVYQQKWEKGDLTPETSSPNP